MGLASCRRDGRHLVVRVHIPRLSASFVGTGDLFTALLTAWLHRTGDNLQLAVEKTLATMQVTCLGLNVATMPTSPPSPPPLLLENYIFRLLLPWKTCFRHNS